MKPTKDAGRGLAVGLTGGIGCGKSEVGRFLSELGAEVLDADEVARDVVRPGTEAFKRVVARFGRDVVDAQGSLDRAKLARIVFADAGQRAALEAIVHPEVIRTIRRWAGEVTEAGRDAVALIPLLYEANLARMWDAVICVVAPEEQVLKRLRARGMTEAEVRARMSAQMPVEEKAKRADYVLDNGGSLAELKRRTAETWNELMRKGAQ